MIIMQSQKLKAKKNSVRDNNNNNEVISKHISQKLVGMRLSMV